MLHCQVCWQVIKTLLNELACTPVWATLKNILANKLTKEDSAMRGYHVYKELRDCLVSNLCSTLLSISISGWQINWSGYVRLEVGWLLYASKDLKYPNGLLLYRQTIHVVFFKYLSNALMLLTVFSVISDTHPYHSGVSITLWWNKFHESSKKSMKSTKFTVLKNECPMVCCMFY